MRGGIWTLSYLALAGLVLLPTAGCEDLPGESGTQGAVIGGSGGAAAGAAVAEENRALGALIGGVLGAGGGYLIGSEVEKAEDADDEDVAEARTAMREAQEDPATPSEALEAETADLNDDGFVTIDEVVAMEEAGLTDEQILDRLEATDQVFELSQQQQAMLRQRGVSDNVVDQLNTVNREQREQLLERQTRTEPAEDQVINQ
jgi:hypothetical protein